MGTSLTAYAQDIKFNTAANGTTTLDLNVQPGETLTVDKTHPEFAQDNLDKVTELTINGGGNVDIPAPEVGSTSLSFNNLKSLNIQSGTFSPNASKFIFPSEREGLNLTLGKSGILDLRNNKDDGNNFYYNIQNLNGNGSIIFTATRSYTPTIHGDQSIFSGTINGSFSDDPSTLPSYNAPYDEEDFGRFEKLSWVAFNGKYVDLNNATIEKTAVLSFTGLGDWSETTQINNSYIRNGSSINVAELLIGHGEDNSYDFGTKPALPSDHNKATVIIRDNNTLVNTAQLVVGQQGGGKEWEQAKDGKILIPAQGDYATDAGHSSGILYVTKGAQINISGGGLHGGIYLGNNAGFGYDDRTNDASRNDSYLYVDGNSDGTMHITGDDVTYDTTHNIVQNTSHDGGIVNVDQGTLWIGPVNLLDPETGSGSGLITVDHGGQLNLKNSFIVLGGQNGTGNIQINDAGILNITGTQPGQITTDNTGRLFSTTRQGALSINQGGVLNIGDSHNAGILRVYGDLNLAQGSQTNFYEGTTSTEKSNKGDAYNSYADIRGNLTLGGNLSINGIVGQNKGQNGAVDVGLYHLFDYTGTLSGQTNTIFAATIAGQTGSYVYDSAAKSVDVMVTNNSDVNTPTIPTTPSGDTTPPAHNTDTPKPPPAPPTHVVSGGDYRITASGGQSDITSSLDFTSGKYHTISGGTITAPVSASNTGQNMLSLNSNQEQNGVINSAIVDNGKNAVGLMKKGTGTVTINGKNSYTGVTAIQSGGLTISKTGDISKSSKTEITSLGSLSVEGKAGDIINNGNVSVTGQTGYISNSGGKTQISGNGQVSSMVNNGHAVLTDNAKVTGTLIQQSGQLDLNDNASIDTLQATGDQHLDHIAGLDRNDGLFSQTRKDFVADQLKNATDPAAKGLLQAISNTLSGNTDNVLDELKKTNNLFTIGSNANVTINNLQGYGTAYLNDGSTMTLAGNNTNYGDAMFGSGRVKFTGQNATLVGTNFYSGGTEIISGANVTSGAHSLGSGTVAIDDNGSLSIHEDNISNFDNSFTGTGTFNKTGQGILTLNASVDDSGFKGQTNVQSGLLTVNNKLGGNTNVMTNAAISGTGTVNNLTLNKGSTLGVTLDGGNGKNAPTIQALHVTGKAAVNDATLGVSVQHLTGLALNKNYTTQALDFKTTGSGFNKTSFDTIFVKGKAVQDQNGLWNLDYRRYAAYNSWAKTANEYAVANALTHADNKGLSSPFMTALNNMAAGNDAGAQARGAYNALSGELNADAKTAMVNDSFFIQEAVINRLDCAGDQLRARTLDGKQQSHGYCNIDPNNPVTVWGTIYGQKGHNSGSNGSASLGQSSIGWIMGADTQLEGNWRLGGMLSYGRDWFDAKAGRSSSAHSNTATVGAYLGNAWRVGGLIPDAALTFKGGVSYSWNMIDTHRQVNFSDYSGNLSSRNRSGTGQIFAETGYHMAFNEGTAIPLEVEPFARMTYVNYGQDSYREHGGDAALRIKGQNSSIGFSTMGIKLASSFSLGKVMVSPHLETAYRRAFGRTNAHIREGFINANNGYDMTVWGTGLSVDTAQINTGFGMRLTDKFDVNVDYIGQYGSSQSSTGGSGSIHYRF
ncbi:autotransporter domain-containing protein [Aristophania vespae]|uniref:autotransporter domain-containing protein n=1 Tax=Aristophania vespae TaxID=2697033 RepID=UPI0023513BF6|nr:autotransporter domain-containing protein [Aristophania vespae]